ncbi:glycosyltransferase family 4 protein [Cellulomonas sp. SLBN-39]|uniref:glycosyltransferase family 4 protein n=1 Tax=Cellulomonas sp. SLBN-39 TaxID=2768446 RepID=UPI001152178C|nr:glycosyltransferase family 4 protein [Cellulomonas sp. SLBN-39]TQL03658.1 glycosyltransferase involved in cell wall biosynthesis [Cellulomonas sp. SLBN-39]
MPRLFAFPSWRDNPYLNMLYLAARGAGWVVEGGTTLDTLVRSTSDYRDGDVLHVHWTSPVCQRAQSRDEAEENLARFTAMLTSLRSRGVHLIWTVHNTLPHETPYRDLEIRLSETLGRLADRVIQLNRQTVDAVADEYTLPSAKVATLAHSSYAGVYPSQVTQHEARDRLGIPRSSPTIGFVGQIRPYKGIETLLAAAGTVAEEVPDLTVVLAGKAQPDVAAALEEQIPLGVRVVRRYEFVDDRDLQTWFRASDLMVFPYQRVLNSGSVLLSATFARPCLLPNEPHLVGEFGNQDWVNFFHARDGAPALAASVAKALGRARSTRFDAERFARSYTPYDMSRDYLTILRGVVSGADHAPADAVRDEAAAGA